MEITRNFFIECYILLLFQDGKVQFSIPQTKYLSQQDEESSFGFTNKAVAPMPGVLDKILVKSGDQVKKGDSIFVLIAMKMEYVVKAARDAKVSDVFFKTGDNVSKDATVVQFEDVQE